MIPITILLFMMIMIKKIVTELDNDRDDKDLVSIPFVTMDILCCDMLPGSFCS